MTTGKTIYCFKDNNILFEAILIKLVHYIDKNGQDGVIFLIGSNDDTVREWIDSNRCFETKEAAKVEMLICLEENYEHLKNAIMGTKPVALNEGTQEDEQED